MIELTELEKKIVENFVFSFNYNDAESEKSANAVIIDFDEIQCATKLSKNVIKGILGSLTKKEIVIPCNEPDPELKNCYWVTDLGIDSYYQVSEKNYVL